VKRDSRREISNRSGTGVKRHDGKWRRHEEDYGLLEKYPDRVEFPVFLQECRI